MNDDGYTLFEALAAMLILGLAIGGLVEGARVIGKLQTPISQTLKAAQSQRHAGAALGSLLNAKPSDRSEFVGGPEGFVFDCPAGPCSARLTRDGELSMLNIRRGEVAQSFRLRATGNVRFVYSARDGRFDHWPPQDPSRALRGVMVVTTGAGGETPVIVARVWIEHPKTCEFDMIARACRTSDP